MVGDKYLKKYDVDTKYNLRTLWKFLKRYKHYVWLLFILIFFIEAISFFDNFLFKWLVDYATFFNDGKIGAEEFLSILLLITLGLFVGLKGIGNAVLRFLKIHLINRLDGKVLSDMERKSFFHMLNLSYKYHINKKTGSIISQFTRGVNKTEDLIDVFVFSFVGVSFRILFSLSAFLYFDLVSGIVLFFTIVIFVTLGVLILHRQRAPQSDANFKEDMLKQNLSDVFQNIDTVKYFGKEKRTYNYFSNLSLKLKRARIKFWDYYRWFELGQTLVIAIGTAAIVYSSFSSFISGNLTLGSVTLIYAALWKLLPSLFHLMNGYRHFILANVDVAALYETFKEENDVVDAPRAKKIKIPSGEIKFESVSFTYPRKVKKDISQAMLKNFNLHIKKNTKIALVGPSGSGKTTIVRLLYRLFDLDEGKILIDNQDISKVTQESLRNSMSIVPQEVLLFDNTIYFNIAYANPKASRRQVWKAIRFAQLDRLIKQLPYGEKTIVGERGVKLSGGEKQRVSIARALLADKKILILDEATSALDSETEREIQRDFEKLMKGRTTIIIAHRLSTIMKADLIIVMQEGKIKEVGTHKQLKKHSGLYNRLWQLQQGGML